MPPRRGRAASPTPPTTSSPAGRACAARSTLRIPARRPADDPADEQSGEYACRDRERPAGPGGRRQRMKGGPWTGRDLAPASAPRRAKTSLTISFTVYAPCPRRGWADRHRPPRPGGSFFRSRVELGLARDGRCSGGASSGREHVVVPRAPPPRPSCARTAAPTRAGAWRAWRRARGPRDPSRPRAVRGCGSRRPASRVARLKLLLMGGSSSSSWRPARSRPRENFDDLLQRLLRDDGACPPPRPRRAHGHGRSDWKILIVRYSWSSPGVLTLARHDLTSP